ncbi:MAG: leucine-rich repeat protein [Ruminococcus sp.]|nr:leucine-rich repeat protein [Ruminococcus sp.]
MKNKILSGIMAVCLVGSVGVIPESIAPAATVTASAETVKSGTYGDNITWTIDNKGTLTISGTGDMMNNDSTIRESERTALKKVIIENGVTGIGNSVFMGCVNLESVTLPDSLTSIGKDTFSYCRSLKSITIPDSVTNIGYSAFSNCTALESVTIPDSVTSIDYGAFQNCTALESVTIPDSVTSISYSLFYNCTSLSSITIPESVTSIGGDAFYNTPWLEDEKKENNFVVVNDILIDSAVRSGDVIIPDNVKNIGNNVFYNCKDITSVTIPDSVTNIGNMAFRSCKGLTSITIPDSVTSIGNMTFKDCNGLTSIKIPDSVTSIGNSTFEGCKNLSEITILNPECEISDNEYTISNGTDQKYNCYFDGTIKGYANSTAQKYAEKYGYTFESLGEAPTGNVTEIQSGDTNGDGKLSIADAVLIAQAISNPDDYELTEEQKTAADVVDKGDGLTPLDSLAIQMVDLKIISENDLPITSAEINRILDNQ